MVGRTLAHYRIVEKLGEGGMGVVYKARDAHLGRYAALKLLLPDKVADPERKRRFVQEAKAASSLNHPNIVTIYDIASEDGIDFIAMEFVPGKTLDQLIPRKGMRLNEVLQYAVQMADALAAAHEAGIVHRDLKPGNVMVSDKGLVKVVDFGLAKLMEPRLPVSAATVTLESAPKTVEGAIVGTVAYMSPEQTEGKPVDARSDIFSFGSMLYEMVTGQRPFRRGSTESTLAAIQHEEPPALDVNSPHDLDVLITRCLRKASERRWQAMADLKVALQDLKEETDSGKLMAPKAARPVRRLLSPILFAGLTVILVGAAVGVFWRMRPGVDTGADTGVEAATVVPLTSFPTLEQHPSLSPDGNQVAFSWNGPEGSNFDIYVKQVDGPGLARLTTDPASDANPAWSPDGKWIAFTRADSGIVLISPIGGPERKLVSTVSRPSWTPDSQSLVFTGDAPPGRARAVVLLSLATGIRKSLTAPPKDYWGDAGPAVSPDGQLIAFLRSPGPAARGDLFLQPLSGGQARQLTHDRFALFGGLTWTPDSKEIVFASDRKGAGRLWRIAVTEGVTQLRPVAGAGDSASSPTLPPKRSAGPWPLAYQQSSSAVGVNLSTMEESGGARVLRSKSLIVSTRRDWHPRFSPDGKKIAFTSGRSGDPQVWTCHSDGSNCVRLTSFDGSGIGPQWSPDGRSIAFSCLRSGSHPNVCVMGVEGGDLRELTAYSDSFAWFRSWSRDGRSIYFHSNRSGDSQIWRVPVDGGAAAQVTKDGGVDGQESPDGKWFYFFNSQELGGKPAPIWRMPAGGGPAERVLENVSTSRWELTAKGIYFVEMNVSINGADELKLLSLETGRVLSLGQFPERVSRGWTGFSASPDGRSFVTVHDRSRISDLILLKSFQ